jgi:hypothetical protein
MIRVWDEAGKAIETHEHRWRFQRVVSLLDARIACLTPFPQSGHPDVGTKFEAS